MKAYLLITFFVFCSSCSTLPLEKSNDVRPENIELSLIMGNRNIDKYKTSSRIKVYALGKEKSSKLIEKKLEFSEFSLNRKTLFVGDNGQVQFNYWVTELQGDIDLTAMGFPLQGKILTKIINKKAEVLDVKGFPKETVFYLPKIVLPKTAVKPGDTWVYKGRWRNLKTGWPFKVDLKLKLKSWFFCGGLKCAYIVYTGQVSLPEDSPLKKAILKSKIKGEFVYAPIGHQFIWSYSNSVETFLSKSKRIEVKSCMASFQVSPNKETKVFSSKFKQFCN